MRDLSSFIDRLIAAHRDQSTFTPGPSRPSSLEEVHLVHEALIKAAGSTGGFKITRTREGEAVVVPIPATRCVPSGSKVQAPPTVEAEVEVGFTVVDTIPHPDDPNFRRKLFASVRPAPMIELVASRIDGSLAFEPMVKLADLQACEALVFGQPAMGWTGADFHRPSAELSMETRVLAEGEGVVPGGSACAALETTVEILARRFGGLRVGQKVLSGALFKAEPVVAGTRVRARVGGLGDVAVEL
ncbi:MAG: hypothetical protein AAFU80_16005 [Pseudomonadota bacterium]